MNEATPMEDQVLAKYVAGEADAAGRSTVEQWAAASAANARELERMRAMWNWSDPAAQGPNVDVDAALQRVNARIDHAERATRIVAAPNWNLRRWVAAAAVVAGLVFAARWFMAPAEERFAANREFVPVMLSDSSAIVLSPGSNIAARIGDQRRVTLEGEAYFEVHRDVEHPFVITTGSVDVTVLGTAFTVNSFDTAKNVVVRVREGRVQVVAGPDSLILIAGERARYDKQRHQLERLLAAPAEVWGDRIIQFEDAPLALVVEQLQRLFPVQIELGNAALANCRLTATFEDEAIDRVLQVIADTYGLALSQPAKGRYLLEGNGC